MDRHSFSGVTMYERDLSYFVRSGCNGMMRSSMTGDVIAVSVAWDLILFFLGLFHDMPFSKVITACLVYLPILSQLHMSE